jgi:hypothetical protein
MVTSFGKITMPGYKGDGLMALIAGGLVLLSTLLYAGKPGKIYSIGAVILGVIGLAVTITVLVNISGVAGSSDYFRSEIGIGIYITLLGCFMMLGGLLKTPINPS